TGHESEVRQRLERYLKRLDDRDFEAAVSYSVKQPFNFQTRREDYQRYLDKHPDGAFAAEARKAIAAVGVEWDKDDFRQVRGQFLGNPAAIPEVVARCRTYLAVHPQGQFAAAATDLLQWTERVTQPADYRVVVHNGSFDKNIGRWLTRGPQLSVTIEVAGVR